MKSRLASFDVFDCVLSRDALIPTDIFHRIGEKIAGLAWIRPSVSPRNFAQLRAHSEIRARERVSHEEVTLSEIWDELFAQLGWEPDPRLLYLELSEDAASIRPVTSMQTRVEQARARYGKVAFISDTYLPHDFIERQLRRYDLMRGGDSLYVSSTHRATKASGNLFRVALSTEGLAAQELEHYGDNVNSDVIRPRRLGIRAHRVDVPDLTGNEKALVANPWSGIGTLRDVVGAARQFRLSEARSGLAAPDTRELVGAFLGPFCSIFAAWVLDNARRAGLSRLYFCARDSQLLWKAARILAPRFGDIDCRYLHVSRQALLLPTVGRATRQQMQWLRRSFEAPLLHRILSKIELESSEWATELQAIGTPGKDGMRIPDDGWEALWSRLEAEPIRSAIERLAAHRRAAAIAYFREQGLFEVPVVGLVDIGWFLTCQTSVRTILHDAGHGGDVHGFYLQLNCARVGPSRAGRAESIFHEPAADLATIDPHLTLGPLAKFLEHVVGLADHPSLRAYDLDGRGHSRLVFASSTPSDDAISQVAEIHAAVERYVAAYQSTFAPAGGDRDSLEVVLGRIVACFHSHAAASAVDCLSEIVVATDQNNLDAHPLVEPMTWREALRPILPGRLVSARYVDPRQPWPRAKYLVTPRLRYAANAMALLLGALRSRLAKSAFMAAAGGRK